MSIRYIREVVKNERKMIVRYVLRLFLWIGLALILSSIMSKTRAFEFELYLPQYDGYSHYMEQSSKRLQCAMKGYTDYVRCEIWWRNVGG